MKVLYEEVTKDFLMENYEVRSLQPQLKKAASLALHSPKTRPIFARQPHAPLQGLSPMPTEDATQPLPSDITSHSSQIREEDKCPSLGPNIDKPFSEMLIGENIKEPSTQEIVEVSERAEAGLSRESSAICDVPSRELPLVHSLSLMPKGKVLAHPTVSKQHSLCFDDTELTGRALRKRMKTSQWSVYVPLAVAIKTQCMSYEPAEELLNALINLLFSNDPQVSNASHRTMYTFAKVAVYIILLTHIIMPPPMSELTISFGSHQGVTFTEGLIGQMPCENDPAVAQALSMVSVDKLIALWCAKLLDIRVIVYTSDADAFFFLCKAVEQLMFPFPWLFSTGVVPNLDLLTNPTPFFYCNVAFDTNRRNEANREQGGHTRSYGGEQHPACAARRGGR